MKISLEQGSTTYYDHTFKSHVVKILPGEYHMTDKDVLIGTVLGSCVAVCLRDRERGIGGMNHFMLPESSDTIHADAPGSARYGVHAMDLLIRDYLLLGGKLENLEAKVFGAGRVMNMTTDVGDQNASFALRYLELRRINVLAVDVGDTYPRKVVFSPTTGKAYVKRLRKNLQTMDPNPPELQLQPDRADNAFMPDIQFRKAPGR